MHVTSRQERLQSLRDHVAKNGICVDDLLPMLSDEAKAVGSAWFGMARPGTSAVVLHMREYRPTQTTDAALEELMAASLVKREPYNEHGSIQYVALANCRPFFNWMLSNHDNPNVRFRLMEPVGINQ